MSSYGAALSEHPDTARAVGEAISEILGAVGDSPDLVVVFITGHHLHKASEILSAIHTGLNPKATIGASAVSVLCGAKEVEDNPAIALWAAKDCPVRSVRLTAAKSPESSQDWRICGLEDDAQGTLLLLSDPFSFPSDALWKQHPRLTVVGGMASAVGHIRSNRLILNRSVYDDGAVAVLTDPSVRIESVVSQGCRPIGMPFTITKSHGNLILEMGGRSAVQRLRETLAGLDEADRVLVGKGLHMGIVIDEHKSEFERGDFLIRSLLGADEQAGVLAVGETVEVGTTVQFQVRDAASADADLRGLMADVQANAALVFTCNGRGTHLFSEPHHDAQVVKQALGDANVAGMFCAGEIGPIAGKNFLHGFTASVVLFP